MRRESKNFILRLPMDLHRQLKDEAYKQNTSLNQICIKRLNNSNQPNILFFKNSVFGKVVNYLAKIYQEHFLGMVLFGSYARQELTSSSDVDLLVILDSRIPIKRDLYRKWDKNDFYLSDHEINAHFVHLPENIEEAGSIWYEVSLEGILLYDNDFLTQDFLIKLRHHLTSSKAICKLIHGQPYWLKKK